MKGTRAGALFEDGFVLCVEPSDDETANDPASWARAAAPELEPLLLRHRAILFRDFRFERASFRAFAATLGTTVLNYTGGAAPRPLVGDDVYLATTHDPRCIILQHHEMSYTRRWPTKLFFMAEIAPQADGETPVCDARRAMRRIAPSTIAKFRDLGVTYVRNYLPRLGHPTWQQSFMTDDKLEVERFCNEAGLEVEWRAGNRLRTRHTAQGTVTHPRTGEEVLFNQCVSLTTDTGIPSETTPLMRTLRPILSAEDFEAFREVPSDERSYNTWFGDGSRIPLAMLEEICSAYEDEKRAFRWQTGDVLLIENMLATHGRSTYEGERRILAVLTK